MSDDSHGSTVQRMVLALELVMLLFGVACSTSTTSSSAEHEANGSAGTGQELSREPDWCAARAVLEAKCQRCHGATPEHGAPFSLVTLDDARALSSRGKARYLAIETALASDFMPPIFILLEPAVAPLSDTEKGTLLAWCRAGAPGEPEAGCDPPP